MKYITYVVVSIGMCLVGSTVFAADLPDLYMYYTYTASESTTKEFFPLALVIQNRGNATTTSTSVNIVCYDANTTQSVVNKPTTLPLLQPWQNHTFSLHIPMQEKQTIVYCAVDSTNIIHESNEANNRTPNKFIAKKVVPPSLPSPPHPQPPTDPYPCGKYPCDFVPLPIIPLPPKLTPPHTPLPPCGWRGKYTQCKKQPPQPPIDPYPCGKYPCDFVPLPTIPGNATSCRQGGCHVSSMVTDDRKVTTHTRPRYAWGTRID